MNKVVWMAVNAAVLMLIGLAVALGMVLSGRYDHLAAPAIIELAGIGFAVLSLREE